MLERVQSEKIRRVTLHLDNELAKSIKRRANELDVTQSKDISDLVSADLAHEDANVRALAQMGIVGKRIRPDK